MLYKHTVIAASLVGIGIIGSGSVPETYSISAANLAAEPASIWEAVNSVDFSVPELLQVTLKSTSSNEEENVGKKIASEADVKPKTQSKTSVYSVPFFSQFADISASEWKKVGCGITSLAMLIDFYEPEAVTVDELLKQGIADGAYISDAGWSHAGLINLSKKYGLNGSSNDMSGSTMEAAFTKLKTVLEEGPVMVSVHYTFDPKNPIPHLVVINGVNDGKVYYNDPAEKSGGGSISISQFQSAWKKRYIQIRTTT